MTVPFSEFCLPGISSSRMMADLVSRYDFASRYVQGRRVLDIACGSGFGSRRLAEAGAQSVTGVDLSDDALAFARLNFSHPIVEYVQGDLLNLTYCEDFDVVVSSETTEHTTEYLRALAQLHQALRPGGVLIITTPNRIITTPGAKKLTDPIPYPYHTQEFTAPEMTTFLVQTGFDPKNIEVYGNRQQYAFPTRVARYIYQRVFYPNHRLSAEYESKMPLRQPRNLLFVARK